MVERTNRVHAFLAYDHHHVVGVAYERWVGREDGDNGMDEGAFLD